MTPDIQKYGYIDALRGIAILGVLLVHSSEAVAPSSEILRLISTYGARGVQLFFVASAITLCMSWQVRNTSEMYPIRNFLLRRFFRIAPMFYLAIAFYVFLYGLSPRYWAPHGIQWWFIAVTALFLHGFNPETISSVVPGGWSIAVEFNFYVMLPLFLLRFKKVKSIAAFLLFTLILFASSKYALSYLLTPHYPRDEQYLVSAFTALNFFGQLPVFAVGLLAYSVLEHRQRLPRAIGVGWLMFIVATALLSELHARNVLSNHIYFGFAFGFLALTLAIHPVKALVNKVTIHLGKISFSMYLSHFAVLAVFSKLGVSALFREGNLSSIFYFLCVVTVTAFFSHMSYLTIELHGIQLGKRLINRLEKSASAALIGAVRCSR
jgi:peptidoglycan/LPS O-acetylase OafA/YrhL